MLNLRNDSQIPKTIILLRQVLEVFMIVKVISFFDFGIGLPSYRR